LSVFEIALPPLRDRLDDILELADAFLEEIGGAVGKPPAGIAREAQNQLLTYSWPGNVRELRNAIERAVILWPAQVLTPEALPERIAARERGLPRLGGDFTLEQIEREHILQVMQRAVSLEDASRILGIDGSTLWRKRRKYEA
jgi:NtrC-family two-component system response regulator AlgB